ncbi:MULTISPECIES: hypothetical protein [unclassified Streptomyces]|uniref:hypothetical protein n=1 Tax=unclassified Streptomyces TaxID=2593676 RepID=UPI002366E4D2|nr:MULTISPECIES: hypothetical protein [unclassified Streptomyces]MDF3148097.1 hypothetical protein [Streptomyces sp. T21Q-yed]WDF40714.1 hypothetical protein PBV52_29990 [Streptomyces sp. T12]
MSGWDGKHEPSEERGQAAWAAREPVVPPPWASAQTQTSLSMPPPLPVPVQPSPLRARRLLLVLVTAAVFGAGVGTGVWYVIRDDSHAAATGTTPLPSVSVSAPSAATSAATRDSASPPGYRRVQDPVGYTLHVPEDWIRSQRQGEKAPVVRYDAPEDGRSLQIFALAEETAAESLDLAENDPGYGFSTQPGYRAMDRASAAAWSELTYRYDDENKGPRQVIDHRFEAADGTLYAIRAAGPEDLAPALVREPLTAALESFCPAGGGCR